MEGGREGEEDFLENRVLSAWFCPVLLKFIKWKGEKSSELSASLKAV